MPLLERRPGDSFSPEERAVLLAAASGSIRHGLRFGGPSEIDPDRYAESLRRHRSSFVTLSLRGRLRGCVGSLEATQALVVDVAANAYKAAFCDPRFSPLTPEESVAVSLCISVLTPLEPLSVESEEDLIRRLRPGVDGLALGEGGFRGTFLPSVWESIPDSRKFVRELKQKAGFSPDYWSDTVKVWRYAVETVSDGGAEP